MFAWILYCGLIWLIPSTVSAHSNIKVEENVKDCDLINEEQKLKILEHTNSRLVNVVNLQFSLPTSSHNEFEQSLSDIQVSLSSPTGQIMLDALERWQFRLVSWTLKTGMRSVTLNVNESQIGCFEREKSAPVFALKGTQHIADRIDLATDYKVCSSYKNTLTGQLHRTCCPINPSLATPLNYECYDVKSFYFGSDTLSFYSFSMVILITFVLGMFWFVKFVSMSEVNNSENIRVDVRTMPLCSFLFEFLRKKSGPVVSFFCYLAAISVFLYSYYLFREAFFGPTTYSVRAVLTIFFLDCILSLLLSVCPLFSTVRRLIQWIYDLLPAPIYYICFFVGLLPFGLVVESAVAMSFYIILCAIYSFLLGLFLNPSHFILHIAFCSILAFYCYNFWQKMDDKYFVLKRIIHEACQEAQGNDNHAPNEHVIPVVSRELYDKVREEFLPYNTTLFKLGLQMFWAFAFSLSIFALLHNLNKYIDATVEVQIVTCAILAVTPYVFIIVREEVTEPPVLRNRVQELVRENPEIA